MFAIMELFIDAKDVSRVCFKFWNEMWRTLVQPKSDNIKVEAWENILGRRKVLECGEAYLLYTVTRETI